MNIEDLEFADWEARPMTHVAGWEVIDHRGHRVAGYSEARLYDSCSVLTGLEPVVAKLLAAAPEMYEVLGKLVSGEYSRDLVKKAAKLIEEVNK